MARIVLDATALDRVNPGSGQYRYVMDLVRGLWRLAADDEFVLCGSRPAPVAELEAVFADGGRWAYRQQTPTSGRGGAYVDQLRWSVLLRRERADLVHALHTFVPLLTRVPVVVTVYDLMFELFPEYAEAVRSRPYRQYRWAVRHRARRVIAISRTTAADLKRLWGVGGDLVDVVALGSDPTADELPTPAGLSSLAAERNLVVSPYNLEPRKNLVALLRAAAAVRRDVPDLGIALYGAAALTPEREAAFAADVAALQLEGAVVRTGLLDARALTWLYRRAAVFVFPSLYEGFGLPVLEAMGAGACVIARGESAMAEVLGDAGILVETRDADALAAALRAMLRDPGRRRELGERARARAREFSVRRMAEETHRAYHRSLAGEAG